MLIDRINFHFDIDINLSVYEIYLGFPRLSCETLNNVLYLRIFCASLSRKRARGVFLTPQRPKIEAQEIFY